ncbi:MAG: hypothetical protein AAGA09_01430 [Pseudomonadota bacterium]
MARALGNAAYDIRPVETPPASFGGPLFGAGGFCKDTMQGACAGILALLGAQHTAGAATTPMAAPGGGLPSLGPILENLSMGGLAGPLELMGGVALFLAARRTIARTIGLVGFIAILVAYMNGYDFTQMLAALSDILQRVAGFIDTTLAAVNESTPTAEL